jgi:hypothetical protein
MTKQRKDGIPQPTDWTRGIDRLPSQIYSLTDVDLVVHRHFPRNTQLLMLVEQKAFNAVVGFAQRDTLLILHQLLSVANGGWVRTQRGEQAQVMYFGLHILTLSHRTPQTSQTILWNDFPVSLDELIRILRFDIDPRTVRKLQKGG